jgi:FG-GAP repeat
MLRLVSRVSFVFVAALAFGAGCGDDKGKMLPVTVIDGGADGGGATACGAVFLSPADLSTLTAADDKDADLCKAGFQTDVELAVAGGANGTTATLYAAGVQVGAAVVSGGRLTFANVQLAAQGSVALSVQVGTGATGCLATSTVMIDCNVPTCSITKPVLSDMHPSLNSADRSSAAGSDYQVAFEVTTSLPDGRDVMLEVAQSTAPTVVTTLTAKAMGGKATFAGVTLRPDGTFLAQAICTDANGATGSSSKGMYLVDTAAPTLDVTSPVDMKHFNPTDLMNGKFQVCASTMSADAVGLPAANANLCAAIGTASPVCGSVAMAGAGGTGCVSLDCPGGAPFNLTVTLKDAAGNPTTKTVQAVTCASTLPSVQIVSPAGDATPFSDVAKHLLAASSTQAFKDSDAVASGAQTTVVACTNRAGVARLFEGAEGSTLVQVGAEQMVVAAQASDNCPNGLGFVARWTKATLTDSRMAQDGTLTTPTELQVRLTDVSTAIGSSPSVKLWVDSGAPNVSPLSPANLCGSIFQSMTDLTRDVSFASSTRLLSMVVDGPGGQATFSPTTFGTGSAVFGNVIFKIGSSTVSVTATEPSGNSSGLITSPCTVVVGQVPVVTFTSPASGSNLCAAGNTSPTCVTDGGGAAGWQGDLSVSVTLNGVAVNTGTVTFALNGTNLGVANIVAGIATLANQTIADAASATITATTSDLGGTGVGLATLTAVVDTTSPDALGTVTAAVESRRGTSFRVSWTAPGDSGQPVSGYDVRVSKTPITTPVEFSAAEAVAFGGTPKAPGQAESVVVSGRTITQGYYFAVAPIDAAGNTGTMATVGPVSAAFNSIILTPPASGLTTGQFSASIEASNDVIADGDNVSRADILVGTQNDQSVYIYKGIATPVDTNAPDVRIDGPSGVGFGRSFVNIGNVDGLDADNVARDDYAIGAQNDGNGKVYIFKGRAVWNATYTQTNADYTIDLGATYATSGFGVSIARLGNVDGQGTDDFAVGAPGFNTLQGRVVIVYGKQGFSTANLETATIDGPSGTGTRTFGSKVSGLGNFYPGAGTSLVSVAAGTKVVYSFGPMGAGTYSVANALHNRSEPSLGGNYGTTLGLLGPTGGFNGVAIAAPSVNRLFLCSGTGATGPFANCPWVESTSNATNFGRAVFAGAHSGTSVVDSLVGDGNWDMVTTSTAENGGPGRVYIMDGGRMATLTDGTDLSVVADSIITLPNGWGATSAQRTGVVRDYNGDGFADLAIGETVANQAGRLVLYY